MISPINHGKCLFCARFTKTNISATPGGCSARQDSKSLHCDAAEHNATCGAVIDPCSPKSIIRESYCGPQARPIEPEVMQGRKNANLPIVPTCMLMAHGNGQGNRPEYSMLGSTERTTFELFRKQLRCHWELVVHNGAYLFILLLPF